MKPPQLSFGYRVRSVALLVPVTIGAYLLFASRWKTTVVLNLHYASAERRLFSALNLAKDHLIEGREQAQSDVNGELKKSLTMGTHTHHLIEYAPGKRIHFWGDHSYNIFGSGHEWIEINLTRKDEKSSMITVDYFENTWLLGIIPVTWQSGRKQERHIIATIFGDNVH